MNPGTESPDSLYGPDSPQPPVAAAPTPGLLDQIVGIFSSPIELFESMRPAPKWMGALLLMAALGLALSLIWAVRADFEVLIREAMERRGQPVPDGLESIAALQRKFAIFGSIGAIVLGVPLATAASAGVLRLISEHATEDELPTFQQCIAADVIPTLVKLPQALLLLAAVSFREIGGATPDKLIPTSLAFWIHPESVKVVALLTWADPFALAYGAMYVLSLRYMLRFKWGAAIGTVAGWCVLKLAVGLIFAN